MDRHRRRMADEGRDSPERAQARARAAARSPARRRVSGETGAASIAARQMPPAGPFGRPGGIIAAILAGHVPEVDDRRHGLLDRYVGAGAPDGRRLLVGRCPDGQLLEFGLTA
jgi:hypothetical protein